MSNLSLEERVSKIEDRNIKVEANKAWEGAYLRRGLVALFTYIVMILVMNTLEVPNPFASAIIPTTGFILSTLSLSFLKDFWIKNIYKK